MPTDHDLGDGPRPAYPLGRTLVSVLDEAVAGHPDAQVSFNGLTRRQADVVADANACARALVELGVRPGDAVGICMDRSIDLVVVLLAVLKAGAYFVPLEPDQPVLRLDGYIEDAAIGVVVADASGAAVLRRTGRRVRVVEMAELSARASRHSTGPLPETASPDAVAYVIFTSGSTGRPKGAALPHRSVVNRLSWLQETFRHGAGDCVLQKTPFGFDVSVSYEFLWPFLSGARLELAEPGGHRDMPYLVRTIRRENVTFVHFVPSVLRLFLETDGVEQCRSLRLMFAGGETLTPDLAAGVARALPGLMLYNVYGPTETAFVTAWRYDGRTGRMPIGRPIANVEAVVLDGERTVRAGERGELCIGGVQVGLGYVGRDDLTRERFVPDPDGSGRVLYRTGDVVRWDDDGLLEFHGRIDRQVKVGGNRLEPAEVESALREHPDIRDAVVLPDVDEAPTALVAFVVGVTFDTVSLRLLRRHLRERLPLAAIPLKVWTLPALPQLPNGKLDRQELARARDRALASPVPVLRA